MLILSRKANESIIIDDHIRITVASVRGKYVRIGIEAPGDVGVFREELILNANSPAKSAPRAIKDRIRAGRDGESTERIEALTVET